MRQQLAQKDAQLAVQGEQLAQKDTHLPQQGEQLAVQAARIAQLEAYCADDHSGSRRGLATYAGRPDVPARSVMPTLNEWAHEVVPPLPSSGRGSVFLGPRQACDGSTGRASTLAALRDAGVRAIVNCTMGVPNAFEGGEEDEGDGGCEGDLEYCRVAVRDTGAAELLPFMRGCALFVERHLAAGRSVLVHCERGVSRSASIVLAHQMRFGSISSSCSSSSSVTGQQQQQQQRRRRRPTRDEAYVAVKSVRQCASPNHGFWGQLAEFARACEAEAEEEEGTAAGAGAQPRAPAKFDGAWATASLALFATCGAEECVRELAGMGTEATGAEAARCCTECVLDHVYGRGCLPSDVQWLCAVYGALEAAAPGARFGARAAALRMLCRDSEWFADKWCGEFRECSVDAIKDAMSKDKK